MGVDGVGAGVDYVGAGIDGMVLVLIEYVVSLIRPSGCVVPHHTSLQTQN